MTKEDRKFFNTKFKDIDKRFDRIESRLDNLEEWTGIADKKFDLIENKFAEVDSHFDKLEMYLATRFAEVERKLDNFFEELDTIRKVSQIHTIKIGRIETGYKYKDR